MSAHIDLIVPTIRGREDSLQRCLDSYTRLSLVEVNQIIVQDSRNCGWGWRKGLRLSEAPYVVLASDDHECIGPQWAQRCIEKADQGLLPCPRVWTPDGRIESQGGDMASPDHLIRRPQADGGAVDFTTIPFLNREQADAIGMLDVHYSSDVWVSYRGRQLGYDTVLCHGYDIRHWQHQTGRGAGMGQGQRDAQDERTVRDELARLG